MTGRLMTKENDQVIRLNFCIQLSKRTFYTVTLSTTTKRTRANEDCNNLHVWPCFFLSLRILNDSFCYLFLYIRSTFWLLYTKQDKQHECKCNYTMCSSSPLQCSSFHSRLFCCEQPTYIPSCMVGLLQHYSVLPLHDYTSYEICLIM